MTITDVNGHDGMEMPDAAPEKHVPSSGNGDEEKIPDLVEKRFPAEVMRMIAQQMDNSSLVALRQTDRFMAQFANEILRRTICVDISPTRAAYDQLRYMTKLYSDQSLHHPVQAITLITKEFAMDEYTGRSQQQMIIKLMFQLVHSLPNIVHIGIYGHYLSQYQLSILALENPITMWTARSIKVRGARLTILENCYNWLECRAFSTDQKLADHSTGTQGAGMCPQLKRLLLAASDEPNGVSGIADLPEYRPEGYQRWSHAEALRPSTVREVASLFPELEWFVLGPARPRIPHQSNFFTDFWSVVPRSPFVKALEGFRCLKRLAIQIDSATGFREANRRAHREDEDLLGQKTCLWYIELTRDIAAMLGGNLDQVIVRASWPHYFIARQGPAGTFTVQQEQFESANRYEFPFGVCY